MNKKISFGFSNVKKKTAIISQKPSQANQVEFIESIQGQTIKVKNEEEKVEEGPLVIPVITRADGKNLIDRIINARNKKEIKKEEEPEDSRPDSELSIDELAAREVIRDARKRENSKSKTTEKVYLLPKVEDKLIIEGEKEPTLDDYEKVPIGDYGLAMLRGMGWNESTGIGRNPSTGVKVAQPELRPKGLGLGAIRMVESKPKEVIDKDGKELVLKSKTYAKIVAGRFRGQYCQVQCLNEDGQVIVKTTLKGEVLILNEIFVTPVTKEEYMKCSKVLNIAKYEDFKNSSKKSDNESETYNTTKQNDLESSSGRHRSKERNEKKNEHSDDDSESKGKSSHQSKDRHRTKKSADKNDSSDDDSEYERKSSYKHKGKSKYRDKSRSRSNERFYKKKLTKSKVRRKSTSSSSDSEYEKKKKSSKSSHRRHRRKT